MVVPYVGTWIEICLTETQRQDIKRRSLRGNVDRNKIAGCEIGSCSGRSLRGNVDRNMVGTGTLTKCIGRSLRGNVDRNSFFHLSASSSAVRSFPTWERG